jgi:hypothetical protein
MAGTVPRLPALEHVKDGVLISTTESQRDQAPEASFSIVKFSIVRDHPCITPVDSFLCSAIVHLGSTRRYS